MKKCTKCEIEKPLEEFWEEKRVKDGRRPRCKQCSRIASKIYREKNREKIKIYREKNRKKMNRQSIAHTYFKKYGITLEEKREMWYQQNGKCFLCEKEMNTSKSIQTDHDHLNGKVRKLICVQCNHLMAGVGNEEWLTKAIAYRDSYRNIFTTP